MNWTIHFFNASVQKNIREWPVGIYADFLRLPHSRAMGQGLFELRCKGREGIGRAFYCMVIGQEIVILHSFIKKTQETPIEHLRIARLRWKQVKNHAQR